MNGISRTWLELPMEEKRKLMELVEQKKSENAHYSQKQFFVDCINEKYKKLKK